MMKNGSRNYARMNDPDFNPQFSRRWTEPPLRKRQDAKRPAKMRAVRPQGAKVA